MSAILNNQIQSVSETRLSSLAMMSVPSHWLGTAMPFVLSLCKCDTTRMVERPVNSTAIYTSLWISLKTIPSGYIMKSSPSTIPLNIPPISVTVCISLIPYIYLHSPLLINPPHIHTQPTFHESPTYTYTAYISFLPYIYLHSPHFIKPRQVG